MHGKLIQLSILILPLVLFFSPLSKVWGLYNRVYISYLGLKGVWSNITYREAMYWTVKLGNITTDELKHRLKNTLLRKKMTLETMQKMKKYPKIPWNACVLHNLVHSSDPKETNCLSWHQIRNLFIKLVGRNSSLVSDCKRRNISKVSNNSTMTTTLDLQTQFGDGKEIFNVSPKTVFHSFFIQNKKKAILYISLCTHFSGHKAYNITNGHF